MKDSTCTIVGPNPSKLSAQIDYHKLTQALEKEILTAISAGYTIFQSSMAMGVDIIAAEIVHKLKREFPHIRLHFYLPCETQANNWSEHWRERYFNLCANADDVFCLQKSYSNGCMNRCYRAMVDCSSRLIAVYDGVTAGNMVYIVRYAKKKSLDIILINPLDF